MNKLLIAMALSVAVVTPDIANAASTLPKELVGEWCPDDAAGCDPKIEGYVITPTKIMPGTGPGGPLLECLVKQVRRAAKGWKIITTCDSPEHGPDGPWFISGARLIAQDARGHVRRYIRR